MARRYRYYSESKWMKRTMINLSKEQLALIDKVLSQMAEKGIIIGKSELIRRAIDKYFEKLKSSVSDTVHQTEVIPQKLDNQ